ARRRRAARSPSRVSSRQRAGRPTSRCRALQANPSDSTMKIPTRCPHASRRVLTWDSIWTFPRSRRSGSHRSRKLHLAFVQSGGSRVCCASRAAAWREDTIRRAVVHPESVMGPESVMIAAVERNLQENDAHSDPPRREYQELWLALARKSWGALALVA